MKKLIIISTICMFAFISNTVAQTTASLSPKPALTDEGLDFYNVHDYKQAIIYFTKAIHENKKDGKAWYYRGLAKMHDGQHGFCKDLEEALSLGHATTADIFFYGCDTHANK